MKPLSPIQRFFPLGMALATLVGLGMPSALAEEGPTYCALILSPPGTPEQNGKKIFEAWRQELSGKSSNHKSLAAQDSRIKAAFEAQQMHLNVLENAVAGVCLVRSSAASGTAFLASRLEEKKKNVDKAMCQGFATEMNGLMTQAQAAMTAYETKLKELSETLKKEFQQRAATNFSSIESYHETLSSRATDLSAAQRQTGELKREFQELWGDNLNATNLNSASGFSISSKAFFGRIHHGIDREQEDAKKLAEAFGSQRDQFKNLEDRCGTILFGPVATLTEDPDAAPEKREPGVPPTDPDTKVSTNPEAPPAPDAKIPDTPPPGTQTTPPPAKSFLAENKEVLIVGGVGVAAVGGILYYKKQQDKKKQEADDAFLSAQMAIQANRSTSSSNSSGGTTGSTSGDSYLGGPPPTNGTPPGSWLSISGIPSGASVNANLTEISVGIVSPQGVLTQDSDTDITVSCEAPVPCSLTGTTTVNTDKGKAIFNNLRFTGPHTGVKLKFSAPGFETAVSPNSFDVTQ